MCVGGEEEGWSSIFDFKRRKRHINQTCDLTGSWIQKIKKGLLSHTHTPAPLFGSNQGQFRAALVTQWWRIRLRMRETRVDPLPGKAPQVVEQLSLWPQLLSLFALEPGNCNYWAHVPQMLMPTHPTTCALQQGSHHNEKPVHCNYRVAQQQKPAQSKTKKFFLNKIHKSVFDVVKLIYIIV